MTLLTPAQIAEILPLHESTIRQYAARIGVKRMGRKWLIPLDAIIEFIS